MDGPCPYRAGQSVVYKPSSKGWAYEQHSLEPWKHVPGKTYIVKEVRDLNYVVVEGTEHPGGGMHWTEFVASGHEILLHAKHGGLHFTIETEGPDVGGYFLWAKREDGIDVDELFDDSVERCKDLALEKYGVLMSSWYE